MPGPRPYSTSFTQRALAATLLEAQRQRKTHDLQLEGRPLVLVPLVFARPVLLANQEAERAIGIGNQARGTAAFWAPEDDGARSASSS